MAIENTPHPTHTLRRRPERATARLDIVASGEKASAPRGLSHPADTPQGGGSQSQRPQGSQIAARVERGVLRYRDVSPESHSCVAAPPSADSARASAGSRIFNSSG